MTIWNTLNELDKELFTIINVKGAMPALDGFFKLLRLAEAWIPLYLFLLIWILIKGKKYAWQFILFSIITFALTDYISASLIKPAVNRMRPCYNADLQPAIRVLVGCAGKFSFPSTHASNHFGLAAFWFFAIQLITRRNWWWLWVWAFMIGYAQVYVGKHYPFDILGGAFLGIIIGLITTYFFKRFFFEGTGNSRLNSTKDIS